MLPLLFTNNQVVYYRQFNFQYVLDETKDIIQENEGLFAVIAYSNDNPIIIGKLS